MITYKKRWSRFLEMKRDIINASIEGLGSSIYDNSVIDIISKIDDTRLQKAWDEMKQGAEIGLEFDTDSCPFCYVFYCSECAITKLKGGCGPESDLEKAISIVISNGFENFTSLIGQEWFWQTIIKIESEYGA